MILFPNAKINIGLHVLSTRIDGYHNIETVMMETHLTDILEFTKISSGRKPEIKITGLDIPGDPAKNLVIKAWEIINEDFFIPPVRVHLHKIIPAGAGLGGGSSDGAYMLKGLNEYFDLQIPFTELKQYASRLGSDCAFFIENKTAFISGKGDIITPAPEILKDKWLCIFNPGIRVSTAEAYSMVAPDASRESLINIFLMDVQNWKGHLVNDFENSVFMKYPLIGEIKKGLYECRAEYASMSGSGSSVYGIFSEKPVLNNDLTRWIIWEENLK